MTSTTTYAVIENSRYVGDGEHQGRISSQHSSLAMATRKLRSRQVAHRHGNPGGCSHLDLTIVAVTAVGDDWARGTPVQR